MVVGCPPFVVDMAGRCARGLTSLFCIFVAGLVASTGVLAASGSTTASPESSASIPLDIRADRIDYLQDQDVYDADGSVIVEQGTLHLTADHITLQVLPGIMIATGHVRMNDAKAELEAERLELNVNTEAGVVTHGQVYIKGSNTTVQGRLLQRFSEDHYRIKEGRFTNCDAQEGETPAWRFRFKDLDLKAGDSMTFSGAWLCVLDTPIVPLPAMSYPLTGRRSGFLIPNVGYDNRFGLHLQEGYFWAINPSQDLTVSPFYYAQLGYGSEFQYRYVIDRKSRGQWLVNYLQQTELPNVADTNPTTGNAARARALITGTHTQQFGADALLRAQANYVTDANYLQQLSNSGAQRALPSYESNLLGTKGLPLGRAYFWGQYLQPLQAGGVDTFQRLPEVGYALPNLSLFRSPLLFGGDTNAVNFYREQGFTLNRLDFLPGISTDVIDFGHVVGLTPQAKFREVYYSRGATETSSQHRETFWVGIDATSKLSRRFRSEGGQAMLHTLEPSVIYEYVPATDQSQIPQITQVDNLPKKNLLTYMLRSKLLQQDGKTSFNWLDLMLAQSYHVGAVQTQARDFTPGVQPLVGTVTQPIQPATVPVDGKKFSDLWLRATIGNNSPQFTQSQLAMETFSQGRYPPGYKPVINQYLVVDAAFDPYNVNVSQINTDFRVQQSREWYVEVGQRYSIAGNRLRRGDVWNPLSFPEVYAPTDEIVFMTAGGGFRTPWGWTIGAKGYYDFKNGRSPEYDIVGLYQNPCKCWSLGLYYLQFPDRAQYNFMLSLTGIGWTENYGTAVLRNILGPLLWGERGLPWAAPGGPYGIPQAQYPAPGLGGSYP